MRHSDGQPQFRRRGRACRALGSTICRIGPVAAAALVIGAGCAPPMKSGKLSEFPIAFVYHTESEARRRAESLADNEASAYDSRTQSENRSVVNVNEFKNYLNSAFGQKSDPKHRGRLALLDARTDELEVVRGAQSGAIPQAWSSDHQLLLFAQGDPGALQLYEFNRETGEVAKLTHGPNAHPQGCYTSEGRIAVSLQSVERSARGNWLTSRLAIRSPSGHMEIISSGPSDGSPSCSPDGQQVAFVRVFGSEPQIWVQSLTPGAAARPVTSGLAPSFSPDGQWIVFGRGSGESSGLWRIRTDGVGRTRLGVSSAAEEYRPVVSPDGRFVIYESVLEHRSRLFLRRFDGGGDVVLFSDGDGMYAIW
jgi:Tol biopolymer transport system component